MTPVADPLSLLPPDAEEKLRAMVEDYLADPDPARQVRGVFRDIDLASAEDAAFLLVLLIEQAREVERLRKLEHERFLAWRDIAPGDECAICGGSGRTIYPSTATWAGGIGGAAITGDVCDECWGSGSRARKGADLRRLEQRAQRAEDRVELLALEREAIQDGERKALDARDEMAGRVARLERAVREITRTPCDLTTTDRYCRTHDSLPPCPVGAASRLLSESEMGLTLPEGEG